MEPDHPIIVARLVGVCLCALPAVRELYEYISSPQCVFHLPISCSYLKPPVHRKIVRMGTYVAGLCLSTTVRLLITALATFGFC
jgi:hypothetical protein